MDIQLVRINYTQWGVEGHLYINRQRICDTVEHPTRHLPEGDYQLVWPIDEALTPYTLHHTQIRHGDGALSAIHGEIIVGQNLMTALVTQSQATYDRLYDRLYERLKKAFQRGSPVHLQII